MQPRRGCGVSNSLYAIRIKVNGEYRIVGKVVDVWAGAKAGKRVFYRNYSWGSALFRKWDALSFDRRVAEFVRQDDTIQEIHYEDKDGVLFSVSKEYFLREAVEGNWGEEDQLYLSLPLWHQGKRDYRAPWTKTVRDLT